MNSSSPTSEDSVAKTETRRLGLNARFIYLASEGFPPTVFDSQVLEHIHQMAELGIHFDLLVFERMLALKANWDRNRKRIKELRPLLPGQLQFRVLATTFLGWDLWLPAFQLNRVLMRHPDSRLLIHARTQTSAAIALRSKHRYDNLRVISDLRGDSGAEYLLAVQKAGGDSGCPSVRKKFARLKAIERDAVENSDAIICVSEVMRKQIIENYGVPSGKIRVIPTVASAKKFRWDPHLHRETRSEHGLDGKYVLIFTGSLRAYQMLSSLIEVLHYWMQSIPNLHLLLITPQISEAEAQLCKLLPVGTYSVKSATHDEMVQWLNAADAGLLLRDLNEVNRVAAPTKFAEYQMAGLPVILTAGIGDYSEFAERERTGVVLKTASLTTEGLARWKEVTRLSDSRERTRIASVAARHLSYETYADIFRELYLSVLDAW